VELKDKKVLDDLKEIIHRDYGVFLTDNQAEQLGLSLLRLTRLSLSALARAEERRSSAQARECSSLEPNTNV
jgi:hypothetical protein